MNGSRDAAAGRPTTQEQRQLIRPLLAPNEPADALTAYYALTHDHRRVQLAVGTTPSGRVDRFVAVCQTGRDLFVPLVVVRAPAGGVADLLCQSLQTGRPYTIITRQAFQDEIRGAMLLNREEAHSIHVLDPSAYRPLINVMVQPGEGPFRFEIRIDGAVVAAAGVNWHTSQLADMYVYTATEFRGRGWAKAVGAACIRALLEAHLLPLYTVADDNAASLRLAKSLGFRDSQAREFECSGRLRC